jgi:hypothetical protein
MTIKSISDYPTTGKLEIDLTSSEGNAFEMISTAKGLSKMLGLEFDPIETDMLSGDYEHLVDVFEKHYGDYVNLYR